MKLYVFLSSGFEECEALGTVDVCRRADFDVVMTSVTGDLTVVSAHGVKIVADCLFEDCDFSDADLLMLPGGMPGSVNLRDHRGLKNVLQSHFASGRMLAAICAAPLVYGGMGILRDHRATCYPGCEDTLIGATYTGRLVEMDGQFITAKGPGAAFELGFAIVSRFKGAEAANRLREAMICAN